ncbi:MAG: hypothetical protein OEW75_10135, partial [Cyclobacteriaceae bacterium]|nr:hypothetical protein [Cyclobacteriaceae bacterium]
MPALIPGYEYDVFISYRHKDNLSALPVGREAPGGWVNGFVKALKNELDATFKENITVYFDENPHDGLHETHDVDGSLASKT